MAAPYRARLLILDDDPGVAKVIHGVAVAGGHDARVVTQSDELFAALDDWQPTHIALDLVMPEIDGIQVLAELGARKCAAAIIITSGMGTQVLAAAGRAARERGLNIAGLLAKPFPPAPLRALLTVPAVTGEPIVGELIDTGVGMSEAEFRLAIENREFRVHYQPKIDCGLGRLVGFEALVRWTPSQARMIMPDQFIPFAEKHGLIDALTYLVLEQALEWFSAQFLNGSASSSTAPVDGASFEYSLSVNLSARSLLDTQLVDRITDCCVRYHVPPARLIFELTESSATESPVAALDVLTRLRLKGFQLSIDDFGTGHSSMLQLVRIPFTEMKVDKTFVRSATRSDESRVVVQSVVDLAQRMGLKSAAEGVEDGSTLTLLRDIGCDFAQGYWIGRPMESDAVPAWIASRAPLA